MTLRCVDTSAWHHAYDEGVAAAWRAALDADGLAICDQVRLGILDSARSAVDYDRIAAVTGQPTEWIAPRGSL